MQIERIYYSERWKMWKIDVAFAGHVYVLPLSVAVEFASRLLRLITTHLTTAAPDAASYEPFPKCDDCGEVWTDHVCHKLPRR